MANVVLRPDRFSAIPESLVREDFNRQNSAQANVRRPTAGVRLKPDRYGSLRVIKSSGVAQPLINTSAPNAVGDLAATYTTNFILQSVQEQHEEKSQVVQTFGADFIYFFGERPVQLQINAQLLDGSNFKWHQEWWENYSKSLRGTELARSDARAYLEVDDVMYEGYITQAGTQKDSMSPHNLSLSFSFLVTNKVNLTELTNSYAISDAQGYGGATPAALSVAIAASIAQALQNPPSLGSILELGSNLSVDVSRVLSFYEQFEDEYVVRSDVKKAVARDSVPSTSSLNAAAAVVSGQDSGIGRGGAAPLSLETAASVPVAPIAAAVSASTVSGSANPAAPSQLPIADVLLNNFYTTLQQLQTVGVVSVPNIILVDRSDDTV